ncbi:unnamed protein product [Arabis nemorensis]|uniref:Uncharacterized protein n=1 Tax=Arabis nemorensis TaxID=586526 RepID=A0A565C762_9BRAS|nr:unnamed protein product [Arabis nemorensis]
MSNLGLVRSWKSPGKSQSDKLEAPLNFDVSVANLYWCKASPTQSQSQSGTILISLCFFLRTAN